MQTHFKLELHCMKQNCLQITTLYCKDELGIVR